MKLILVISLTFACLTLANGQRTPAPVATPNENPINSERQKEISNRSDALRLTEKFPVTTTAGTTVFRENIRPLYRDLKTEEEAMVAPDAQDLEKYSEILNQKNTGLIKLISDQGCDKDFGVLVASEHCSKYLMPGAAASYSFRAEKYRMRQLGDVIFAGEEFQAIGELTQGIFLVAGDVPLEKVGLETKGVSKLMEIAASENMDQADELTKKLVSEDGIRIGEFSFRSNVPVAADTTYILRSIAYRGSLFRTIHGLPYDELEFDKRREITVAFRVVRLEGDETVTILWKELANAKSPKLKDRERKK